MKNDEIVGFVILVLMILLIFMTLVGALIIWILGHFVEVVFSWWLALAIGLVIALSGVYPMNEQALKELRDKDGE